MRSGTRRALTAGLAVLASVLIVLAVFWVALPQKTATHPVLTPSSDVQVDRFSGSPGSGPQGVEPDVAVSANGTIGIAWIGFDAIVPTLYFDAESNFTTGIWYAQSGNGGQSFSTPELVSGGCQECVDPSLVFGPNGTAFICYLSTPSSTHFVWLAYRLPGQANFVNVTVASGAYLDRPWIAQTTSATLEVVYDSPNGIYLASSPEDSPRFSPGALVLNLDGLVASFGQAYSGADYFGVLTQGQVNFATLPAGAAQATATATIPINVTGSVSTQAPILSKPGPAVAESASDTFLTYVSNNDTSLWLLTSQDSGDSWGAPRLISTLQNGTIAMPSLAVNAVGDTLVIVWLAGNDGYWNTYAVALSPLTGTLSSTVRVSSQNGYLNDVRSWHGDFLGVAFDGNTTADVSWSDGRGESTPDVGFGHVYSAVLTVGTS